MVRYGVSIAIIVTFSATVFPQPPDVIRGASRRPWLEPPAKFPEAHVPAQELPPPVPANKSPIQPPLLQRFDTASLRLKRERGMWQLWAGNVLLKDFGPNEADAYEALQIFRDLRVDSHGSIGGIFEFWLTGGQAPSAVTRHRKVVPFDLATLRVEEVSKQWVLRDARMILFSFGTSRTDAVQALNVCKQYEFNQLGLIGHPTPIVKYLMKDPNPRQSQATPQSLAPVSVRMTEAETARPRFVLASAGDVGERVLFDSRRLDLRREGGEWVLYMNRTPAARFGAQERQARSALQALQQLRVTELCQVGESNFGFFLSNGRAPQGSVVGLGGKSLRVDQLNAKQMNGTWSICEGNHPIFEFGDQGDAARRALAAIRELKFDHAIPIGSRSSQTYLLVKTRF